jgi:malonate-semialdehyde dehydrogenase (acetylating)/methylmalonate-semialdehyde dehydrogenase
MKYSPLHNYISGELITDTVNVLEVVSPSDGSILSTVPLSNYEAVNKAVKAAEKAFPGWSAIPVKERAQIFTNIKHFSKKILMNFHFLYMKKMAKHYPRPGRKLKKVLK